MIESILYAFIAADEFLSIGFIIKNISWLNYEIQHY